MRSDTSRGTFEQVVQPIPPQIAALAYQLRDILSEVYPDVLETPRPAEQHADYGISSNQRAEIFGYICPLKDYVRLGFYYGAALPDPNRLLQGQGKRLRHIKIYSPAEAERPEVRQLLEAAVQDRMKALFF